MYKAFFLQVLLFLSSLIIAQDKPPFLPEDVETMPLILNEFSKPGIINKSRSRGIELSWTQVGGGKLEQENGSPAPESTLDNFQQLLIKLRVPIINKDNLRILVGYSYRPEKYNFQQIRGPFAEVFRHLDGRWLRSQQSSLYINKPLNENKYLSFRLKVAFNGDYDSFFNLSDRYRVFSASGLYAFKRNENMEWGLGLNFSTSFRRTIALPFIMYNRNFTDNFGLEAFFPASIMGRWNIHKNTLSVFGLAFSSRSYGIDVPELLNNSAYNMNHSELRAQVRLEQKVFSWIWLETQFGYQYNFSTDFETDNNAEFKLDFKNSPYFKIGIFLSPPDELVSLRR